jgi:uncharacterized protein
MITQYGTIAWRLEGDGKRRFLLITSRETKRWVIPRGNPIAGLEPWDAAAQEAWEEAGVRGEVEKQALGTYEYGKRKPDGSTIPATVHVFALRVAEQEEEWPEARQRERKWFEPEEAAEAVEEEDLKSLLLGAAARLSA